MFDFRIPAEFKATHKFDNKLEYDEVNRVFRVDGKLIYVDQIRWFFLHKQSTMLFDDTRLEFCYNTGRSDWNDYIWVSGLYGNAEYLESLVEFLRGLGIKCVTNETQQRKADKQAVYDKRAAEVKAYYDKHPEELQAKVEAEEKKQAKRKARWSVIKPALIGFGALYGFAVIMAILEIMSR